LTILLLIATLISLVAWIIEREETLPYESITILAIVLLNGVLGYMQENRAEHAAARSGRCLRHMPWCCVMGSHNWCRWPR
jgi:magnesium-transporting ATPase (P-type)